MSKWLVTGTFEGYIEADSAEEAEDNFHETDIEDISVISVDPADDLEGE
jgi:hypothetical protein